MNLEKLFKAKKALLEGHFLLTSGLHSDKYMQCAKILQYPDIAEGIAKLLIKKIKAKKIDVVVSPAIGGIVIGQELARILKCRAIFCERENGKMTLRRGFEIKKNEKCLVVEDVITTGGSVKEIINIIKDYGGVVIGVACVVDRSDMSDLISAALKINIKTYKSLECPLCKKGLVLVKPGSRNINKGR
ncbi:MAG TPA: orotate phosphoribosyltransferase [Elusimicrobia bacterium]|nr:orotate phosphoribosyltransferase [Elusimicrobiota bacterium]